MNLITILLLILLLTASVYALSIQPKPVCTEHSYMTKAKCVNSTGYCRQLCQDILYVCKNNTWVPVKAVSKVVCK